MPILQMIDFWFACVLFSSFWYHGEMYAFTQLIYFCDYYVGKEPVMDGLEFFDEI
jgi:hypothetical protein